MATIRERKTKDKVTGDGKVKKGQTRYQAIVRLRGYPQQSATFSKITDAKKWIQNTESAIREGRYFKSAEARRHTLGGLVDRYVENVLPRKSEVQRGRQKQQLLWWKKKLGDFTLVDVTPARISETRDELYNTRVSGTASDVDGEDDRKVDDDEKAGYGKKAGDSKNVNEERKGKQRSPASVNRYLAALSHAFTVAVREWEWVDDNPVKKVGRLKEPRGRVRFLTNNERKNLLEACEENKERLLYPIVVLALSTGARQGEILGLRWSDVDLERGFIRFEQTKNDERRSVPLAGLAFKQVEKLSRVRRIDTDLVFAGSDGDRPVFVRGPWNAAVKEAKIEDFRFHDLRHSAASYLAMNGATLAEIAEVLGHKTLQMVKRYAHLSEQHTSKVVADMNEKIFGGGSQ